MEYYATLGPACHGTELLEAMIRRGMTGVRLNLSHSDLGSCGTWIASLREAERRSGRSMEFLIDLCGPELRIGNLAGGKELQKGDAFLLYSEAVWPEIEKKVHRKSAASVPPALLRELDKGDLLSVSDGALLLRVIKTEPEQAFCRAEQGGTAEAGKSIALLGREIPLPVLSERDLRNLGMARDSGVTAVMQSFTGCGEDVRLLKREMQRLGLSDLKLLAKIETQSGLNCMEEIAAEADQVVIARGDLGNTLGLTAVPLAQRRISMYCRERGISFMVVTELLHSMMTASVPTQAELSDIARAVWDGASALMLTGETAVGRYPIEAMGWLAQAAERAAEAG